LALFTVLVAQWQIRHQYRNNAVPATSTNRLIGCHLPYFMRCNDSWTPRWWLKWGPGATRALAISHSSQLERRGTVQPGMALHHDPRAHRCHETLPRHWQNSLFISIWNTTKRMPVGISPVKDLLRLSRAGTTYPGPVNPSSTLLA
jgi:hypothetical protein